MKSCIRCGIRQKANEFYHHPMMKDGRLNACRTCVKRDQAKRVERLSRCPEWVERERVRQLEKARKYRATKEGLLKDRARSKVKLAIAAGRLKRLSCEVCGNPKSEAHHDDYSKPLDVRWLCLKHHRKIHEKNL